MKLNCSIWPPPSAQHDLWQKRTRLPRSAPEQHPSDSRRIFYSLVDNPILQFRTFLSDDNDHILKLSTQTAPIVLARTYPSNKLVNNNNPDGILLIFFLKKNLKKYSFAHLATLPKVGKETHWAKQVFLVKSSLGIPLLCLIFTWRVDPLPVAPDVAQARRRLVRGGGADGGGGQEDRLGHSVEEGGGPVCRIHETLAIRSLKSTLQRGTAEVLHVWGGERQFSDKEYPASQISDKPHYLQISDRKGGTKQFSDTHRKGDSLFYF